MMAGSSEAGAVATGVSVPVGHELACAACPVCGDPRCAALAEHPKVVFVSCLGCGVIYRRSFASGDDPGADAGVFVAPNNPRYLQRGGRRIQKARHQILDLLNHSEPGPLLDVGCSVGHTLVAARQLGVAATGVDVRPDSVNYCRELGFRAEIGTLERLPFGDGEFQMIVLKHVLEHTPRPRLALRETRRVLRPGGGIFIAVPNGAYRKARRDPQRHKFFRGNSRFGHYVYYEPATLAQLLSQEGFRTVRVHPHLLHRRAGSATRLLQMVAAPLRLLGQSVLNAGQLRKEFWVCALRVD